MNFNFNAASPMHAAGYQMQNHGGAAGGAAYVPPQAYQYQPQPVHNGGAAAAAAAAPANPKQRKFKEIDLSPGVLAARQACEDHLAEQRAAKIKEASAKAVVKGQLVEVVVGSATAAPAKGAAITPAYRAAALASEAALAVHELTETSGNYQSAAEINALIAGMVGLDVVGLKD